MILQRSAPNGNDLCPQCHGTGVIRSFVEGIDETFCNLCKGSGYVKEAVAPGDGILSRVFESGATRSSEADRYDPEGFLSPIVIERYCQYMYKHRQQPDGAVRPSDNWQKGIPIAAYMKGLWRHLLHLWTRHRGYMVQDPKASSNIEEDLCAIIFNAQGYLFEILKAKRKAPEKPHDPNVCQCGSGDCSSCPR